MLNVEITLHINVSDEQLYIQFRIIIMNFPVLQENVKIPAVPAGRS